VKIPLTFHRLIHIFYFFIKVHKQSSHNRPTPGTDSNYEPESWKPGN